LDTTNCEHRSDDGFRSKVIVESCILPINETYHSLERINIRFVIVQ